MTQLIENLLSLIVCFIFLAFGKAYVLIACFSSKSYLRIIFDLFLPLTGRKKVLPIPSQLLILAPLVRLVFCLHFYTWPHAPSVMDKVAITMNLYHPLSPIPLGRYSMCLDFHQTNLQHFKIFRSISHLMGLQCWHHSVMTFFKSAYFYLVYKILQILHDEVIELLDWRHLLT